MSATAVQMAPGPPSSQSFCQTANLLSRSRNPWRSPEASIGDYVQSIGPPGFQRTCWDAKGPARESYKELAADICKYLGKRGDPVRAVTWTCFMIGWGVESARPNVAFVSADPIARRKVRKIIKDSTILERYPGFQTMDCNRPPGYLSLVDLAGLSRDVSDFGNLLFDHAVLLSKPFIGPSGIDLSVTEKNADRTRTTSATGGGILEWGGRYFTTTVAHAFHDGEINPLYNMDAGDDFEYDIDEDEDDINCDERIVAEVSNRWSTASVNESFECGTSIAQSIFSAPAATDNASDTTSLTSFRDEQFQAREDVSREQAVWSSSRALTGPFPSSIDGPRPLLDYALLDVTEFEKGLLHSFDRKSAKEEILGAFTPYTEPWGADIFALTKSRVPIFGRLLGIPTYMAASTTRKQQELWTIHLNGSLQKGDCGCWVVDASSGRPYGYIIAGSLGAGAAYIIPLVQLLDDAHRRFGLSWNVLPTSVFQGDPDFAMLLQNTPESEDPLHLARQHYENIGLEDQLTDKAWRRKTLLTLDDGGVRGISALLILRRLMDKIAEVEKRLDPKALHSVYPLNRRYPTSGPDDKLTEMSKKNSLSFKISSEALGSPYLPCHYFDYIAGSGTGGLVAIMVSRLRMTVDAALEVFLYLSNTVFGHPREIHIRRPPWYPREKYDTDRLERAIRAIAKLRDPEGHDSTPFHQDHQEMCKTIIVTMQQFTVSRTRIPYIIRSYDHPKNTKLNPLERNAGQKCQYEIWKVARATLAAPTYFKPMKLEVNDEEFEFTDGGFVLSNPSQEAYRSVKQLYNDNPRSVSTLVSIGTGINQELSRNPSRGYDMFLYYLNAAAKKAIYSEHTHEIVTETTKNSTDYYRLNVEHGLGKMKLDSWKGTNGKGTVDLLVARTEAYLNDEVVKESITEAATKLVNIRRQRASEDPDRWEQFCHGVNYRCPVQGCNSGETYEKQKHLREHLEERHAELCTSDNIEGYLDDGKRYPSLSQSETSFTPAPSDLVE